MFRSDILWLIPAIIIAVLQVKWVWRRLPNFEEKDTLLQGEYNDLEIFKFDYFMYLTYLILLVQLAWPLFTITNSIQMVNIFRISGYFLIVCGFLMSLLALKKLGKNWTGMDSYRIKKDQELVTAGIYRLVRHPIYSAVLLELVGFELIANSYLVLLFVIFGGKIFLNHINKEEKLLEKAFRNKFKDYKNRTKMLIPFIY